MSRRLGSIRRNAVSQWVDHLRLRNPPQVNSAHQVVGLGTINTAAVHLISLPRARSLLNAARTGSGLLVTSAASRDRLVHLRLVHPDARRMNSGKFYSLNRGAQISECDGDAGSTRRSAASPPVDPLHLGAHLRESNAHLVVGRGTTSTTAVLPINLL